MKTSRAKRIALCICTCALLIQFAAGIGQAQGGAPDAKVLAIAEENAALLERLQNYPNLEVLSITCVESLQSLPDSIGALKKLRELRRASAD